MELTTVWFLLIAVLWIGYFVLEGFDFGVGMLVRVLGRDEPERQAVVTTIGPVWDGNEVWLLVAGGATFAAFPEWYASMFSAFYLPLFGVLIGLIVRGVALEYRGKRDDQQWRDRWDVAVLAGSLVPALVWGVAFANVLRGIPLDADHEYAGGLADVFGPFALLGGVTFVALFVTHAAIFVSLRTTEDLRDRAHRLAARTGWPTAVLAVAFLVWGQSIRGDTFSAVLAAAAAAALLGGLAANRGRRDGWAFAGTAIAIALATASIFAALYPAVLPTTLATGADLTVTNAAATGYTLKLLTIIAAIATPVVLLYQGWTYWVFRKRIGVGRKVAVGS